jgi:hypothetical protein
MDEKIQKACQQEIAMLGAQLQKSRIKKDSLREALEHEEERHTKLLGGLEAVTAVMEKNSVA